MPTKKNTFETKQKQSLTDIPDKLWFSQKLTIREGERGIALKIELLIF